MRRSFTYQTIERSWFVDGGSESSKCHGHCDSIWFGGGVCGYILLIIWVGGSGT